MTVALLRRRRHDDGDSGFALVFVLLVTTMIMAAVGTTMFVAAPNIVTAKQSQDATAALTAAQSGINDAVAYLTSIPSCRSETRICNQALGASSAALNGTAYQRPSLGTNQSFSWTTGSTVTSDGYVRVTSVGKSVGTTKKLVADLSLQPSILAFGYYTNYESQSPAFLYDYYNPRNVYLSDSGTYRYANAYNTSGRQISVNSPTTVNWQGPPTNGTNPYPAQICGQHWYYESAASPGRYNYGSIGIWGEKGTVNGNSMIRTSACDVVFTSGMTEDGPIYTRDALYISDGTSGGTGPIFKAPVYSLWGYKGYNTPAPPAQPWRQDPDVGGTISSSSPYSPAIATADLSLPKTVGEDGISDDSCVYYGPTRVKLNGDGTATVTSPDTITAASNADPNCYPNSLAGGILNFTLNYKTTGSGTILVKNAGTVPTAGWASNPTKSTQTPSGSNEVFYLPAQTGGSAAPDKSNSSAAPDTCSATALYTNTASAPCAWTSVATAADGIYGWKTYTKTTCAAAVPTDREEFECDYSGSSGSTQLSTNLNGGYYDQLRTVVQNAIASGNCVGQSTSCLNTIVNNALAPANTSNQAAGLGTPAKNDVRYLVVASSAGATSTGTPVSFGAAPASPTAGDSMFTYNGQQAQETATKTPVTIDVARQVYNGSSWGSSTGQFELTVTNSAWNVTQQASGASYFPNPLDVTEYNTGSDNAGNAVGTTAANQPGDIYVDGANSGKLSLIAENDVVVTGDIADQSSDTNSDAVDITAGGDVRNYHPVKCADQTAADINATSSGWCPNDLTGLTTSTLESNGTMYSQHPAMQYTNMLGTGTRRIDAALFALSGSFRTDNYNRGLALGQLNVNGGIYQSNRGANGIQWAYNSGESTRPTSGYSLNYHYIDLQRANLPYAPPATSGSNTRVWNVVSISAGS